MSREDGQALNPLVLAGVPAVFKVLMVAIMRTCRVRTAGAGHVKALRDAGRHWLYSGWHNNIAMAMYLLRNQKLALMTSASRDGELIGRVIERFGNVPIRGSSSFRGGQAAREMARFIRRGGGGAISPDGPRGPACQCQPGAVWIAALAGCALVPYHIEAERQWRIKSWDRHKIAKPFTTIHEHFGEPLYITRGQLDGGETRILEDLQERMLKNMRGCLEAAGHAEEH